MRELLRALREYDPQLILWFDPVQKKWKLLRRPIRYGTVPKDGLADWEIMSGLNQGTIWHVHTLEHEPGFWLLDWLKERDTWSRKRAKEIIQEMDARNEQSIRNAYERLYENIRYQILEDWKHIRDELRGDTIFRKWSALVS